MAPDAERGEAPPQVRAVGVVDVEMQRVVRVDRPLNPFRLAVGRDENRRRLGLPEDNRLGDAAGRFGVGAVVAEERLPLALESVLEAVEVEWIEQIVARPSPAA